MADTVTAAPAVCDGARPLRRDAERNRLRILAAAGEVFARDGLDVTMDQIAEHAGVGIATMYRRFPNKELLIDALFEDRIGRVASLAEKALEFTDAWKGLVFFMEESQRLFADDRGLVDAVFEPIMHGPDGLCRARMRLAPLGEQLIRRAQADGRLRADVEPTDLPLLQLMTSLVILYTDDLAPETWARFLGILLDGLRTQRRGPTPLPSPALSPDQLDASLASRGPARTRRSGAKSTRLGEL